MPSNQATYSTWNNNTNASWWKDKGLRRMIVHIGILYCCIFTFGYDGSLLNGLQTIPRWQTDFDRPTGSDLGLIGASFYLPKIVSPTISALIADRFGRRIALLVGSIISVTGALINTFAYAHDRGFLMAGRAVLGFGLGMQAPIAPAMIQELCHPRLRSIAGAMYLTFFYVGSTLAAWLSYGMIGWDNSWAWRLPTLIQAFGTGLIGIYILCGLMVESPRWLVSVGQDAKALKVLADMHANGDIHDELVLAEMSEIVEGYKFDSQTKTSYLSFFQSRGNRKRLLVLIVTAAAGQLNGVGLVSYYLAPILRLIGITSPTQQAGINGGLAIFNLFTTVTFAQFVERIGRRPLWLTGSTGLLFTFAIITGLSGSFASNPVPSVGTAVIPFFFVFYFFNNMAWATLANLYTAEILPFALRSKGLSIYVTTQSVSLAFNQYVNPVALAAIAWRYYIVYLAVQVGLVVFAYFFYPETKGYTIEEVSRLFDGKDEAARVAQHVAGPNVEDDHEGKGTAEEIELGSVKRI